MNQIIEVNIADVLLRLESKIDASQQNLEAKIDKLDEKVNQISKELSDFKTEVKTDIGRLDEKVSGVSKRLDNLEFIAHTVGGAIIIALLLALARYLFPSVTL
jgi:tetrahydromethanopterin S-methyltransferase subunit B